MVIQPSRAPINLGGQIPDCIYRLLCFECGCAQILQRISWLFASHHTGHCCLDLCGVAIPCSKTLGFQTVLKQMYHALKPNGLLWLTVPQHRWLWSGVDDYACHVRRYTARELHEKLVHAGFTIVRRTSFITCLLPLMFISRLLQRRNGKSFDPHAELQMNPLVNRIIEAFLYMELWFIRRGVSFPVGGSRLIVATKIVKKDQDD